MSSYKCRGAVDEYLTYALCMGKEGVLSVSASTK